MLEIGEKLRTARTDRNLSVRELAAKVEVSPSLLSQIENGKANPSVVTLYNIATTLALPLDYFFPSNHQKTPSDGMTASELRAADASDAEFGDQTQTISAPIVRANQRPTIELLGGVQWERLTSGAEDNIEFLEITYAPGATSGVAMSHHTGREFGLILAGELTVELGFESHQLCVGDSIIFDSNMPHRLVNNGATPVRALWVIRDRQ